MIGLPRFLVKAAGWTAKLHQMCIAVKSGDLTQKDPKDTLLRGIPLASKKSRLVYTSPT